MRGARARAVVIASGSGIGWIESTVRDWAWGAASGATIPETHVNRSGGSPGHTLSDTAHGHSLRCSSRNARGRVGPAATGPVMLLSCLSQHSPFRCLWMSYEKQRSSLPGVLEPAQ